MYTVDCSLDLYVHTGVATSGAPTVNDDIVQNKLAVIYTESSQFHEINNTLMAIKTHALSKDEKISQFSTSFPWQVHKLYVCVCIYISNIIYIGIHNLFCKIILF